jgi:hypothetical protein
MKYCMNVAQSNQDGYFGNGCNKGSGTGICDYYGDGPPAPGFVWHGFCGGAAYAPYRGGNTYELGSEANGFRQANGFRLYIGP